MKTLILSSLVVALFTTGAHASDKTKALNLCKTFVNANYADANLRKVKRIKERRGAVEIKFRIVNGEEKIKGLCVVDNDELTFTANGVEVSAK